MPLESHESVSPEPPVPILEPTLLTPPQKMSELAIVSLVFGIIGIILSLMCCLGLVFGVGAIICGYLALMDIKTKPHIKGKELAWGGIGLGIASIILYILIIMLTVGIAALGAFQHPTP